MEAGLWKVGRNETRFGQTRSTVIAGSGSTVLLHETALEGCFLVESQIIHDERGSFARIYCSDTFGRHGLHTQVAQCNVSRNTRIGTLRGLHFQSQPHEEAKLVSCTRGRMFDVVVDLRTASPTFGKWNGVELTGTALVGVYVPEGLAHGFITLEPNTEILYQISVPYRQDATAGLRWNDPDVGVVWPDISPLIISERDRRLPLLAEIPGTMLPRG